MSGLSAPKCLWVRGNIATYPLKPFANADYDIGSITAVFGDAVNHLATLTIIYSITFCARDGENVIAIANIMNANDGSIAMPFNHDEEPNTGGSPESGSKPRTIRFGHAGLRLPFGIGVDTASATSTMVIAYRDIIP